MRTRFRKVSKLLEKLVCENDYLAMYERRAPGKTQFIIFRKGPCALEEVKRMRGGGHTTAELAQNEFNRLTCVAMYYAGQLIEKPTRD